MVKHVVPREVAEEEITSWLDTKKIYETTRDNNKDNIEILIEGLMRGDLTLSEKGEFTHNLLHPPNEEIRSLTYRSRLNDNMLIGPLTGVKSSDGEGRLLAHVSALTNVSKPILKGLDSADKKIYLAIAVFFL